MSVAEATLTALIGREVYTTEGMFVGEVEDLRIDTEDRSVTGLALTEVRRSDVIDDPAATRDGVLLPYRVVRDVGDVILIHDVL